MNSRFQFLTDDEIALSFFHCAFKLGHLFSSIKDFLRGGKVAELQSFLQNKGQGSLPGSRDQWLDQGVPCEILKPSSQKWIKGKVRFRVVLEFCPDETEVDLEIKNGPEESPLDNIRRSMNEIYTDS